MKEEEKGTYKRRVRCSNCDFREEVEIPKGMTAYEWGLKEENEICSNCGCSRRQGGR